MPVVESLSVSGFHSTSRLVKSVKLEKQAELSDAESLKGRLKQTQAESPKEVERRFKSMDEAHGRIRGEILRASQAKPKSADSQILQMK